MRILEIQDLIREKMAKNKLGAFLVLDLINLRYLTGFKGYDPTDGCLLITKDKTLFFTDSRYIGIVADCLKGIEIVDWTFTGGIKILPKYIPRGATVGCERAITHDLNLDLRRILKNRAVHSSMFIESYRAIKTPWEIAQLRRAGEIVDKAYKFLLTIIKVGLTEYEIAYALNCFLRKESGNDQLSFETIVAVGPNSTLPHYIPEEDKARKVGYGDVVLCDFGPTVNGYCGDSTITFIVGESNPEFEKIYQIVKTASEFAISNLKIGMTCGEADALARDIINNAGHKDNFGHALGHAVGLGVHDIAPHLTFRPPNKYVILMDGHCFTVEDGIYLPGKFGVRLERFGVLTEAGYLPFNNFPFDLVVIPA